MFTAGKEWKEEEINFLKENHSKMSIRQIADTLGRTHSSVENKSGKLGLKGERKYIYDFDFFKNPLNEFSAYWVGFIAADGAISKDNKSIGISLKKDDYEHLKKFNKSLKGNIPVTFRTRKESYYGEKYIPQREQCEIRIYNMEMVKDLTFYKVIPQKSFLLEFPKFESDMLYWSYIRGYFDGDGSIYYDKRSNQLRCKITSASPSFIDSFSKYLKIFEIKTYITNIDCGITGKECTKIFLSKLYDNANIYLDRKYKKYQNYKYLFGFNK